MSHLIISSIFSIRCVVIYLLSNYPSKYNVLIHSVFSMHKRCDIKSLFSHHYLDRLFSFDLDTLCVIIDNFCLRIFISYL